jgi:hypothetical protein
MNPTLPFWIVCVDPYADPYERERDPCYETWEGERFLPIFTDQETAHVFIKGVTDWLISGELFARAVQDDTAMMAIVNFGQTNRSFTVNPKHDQKPTLIRF